ncbi:MAG: hypothetical protein HY327_01485 [Chloroflexi bacterium]|nr:hypothetical protein [Chloroflexota bacterium]
MSKRLKIRIFYIQCPTLDTEACSFLLLSQNSQQDALEFEIHNTETDLIPEDFTNKSSLKKPIARERILSECKTITERYDEWVKNNVHQGFGARSEMGSISIFITEIPLELNFYARKEEDVAVISIAAWRRHIAPPSALEFIIRIVQRLAVPYLLKSYLRSHFATRGCLFDFNQILSGVKNSVLLGYICEDCRNILLKQLGENKVDAIIQLVDLKWIGKVDEAGSVANILKKSFHYELDLTKGLKPTWLERVKEVLPSTLTQQVIVFITGFLLAALLFYLRLK